MRTEATFSKSAVNTQEGVAGGFLPLACWSALTNEVSTAVTNLLGPMRRDLAASSAVMQSPSPLAS
jgi:hypothetical protein